jgi:hypothetical protein
MAGRVSVCDLCKKVPPRRGESVLCQDCADAISTVMSVDKYEANYYQNLRAQLAQVRLLVRAVTCSSESLEDSQIRTRQRWLWL